MQLSFYITMLLFACFTNERIISVAEVANLFLTHASKSDIELPDVQLGKLFGWRRYFATVSSIIGIIQFEKNIR